MSLIDGGFPVDVTLAGSWWKNKERKGRKKERKEEGEVSVGVLRADRTEVLQKTLPLRHVSITQPPLSPHIPWECSTRPGPGGLRDGQQERGSGAALGQQCAQRTCSEHPSVSMHRGAAGAASPGRERHSQEPPAAPASRQQCTTACAGAVSQGCQRLEEPPASYLGRNNISQSLFPQQRKKRASWEGKRTGAWC